MEHVLASPAARRRATLLWLGVSAGTALGAVLAGPVTADLVRAPGATFADLLVQCCAALALVAGSGLWLAASDVAWTVLRRRPATVRRRVGPVRAGLLALCGVTALAGPAFAGTGAVTPDPPRPALDAEVLAGLPLPDRPVGPGPGPGSATVQVRPGDTLWAIAAEALGPGASAADVTSYWHRIHERNAAAIGPDPDRILPGQVLHLPLP